MTQEIEITVRLRCAVRRDDEAGVFVSYCPGLNLYSQGMSQDEAIEAIESTIRLYIKTCYGRGILNEVLQKAGFNQVSGMPPSTVTGMPGEFIAVQPYQPFDVTVPLYLIAQHQQAAACPH